MKRYRTLVIVLDLIAVTAVFVLDDVALFMMKHLPECFLNSNFGIACPTCGATRCVYNFFCGNLGLAFSFNPFVFFLIVYLAAVLLLLNLAAFGIKGAQRTVGLMHSWQAAVVWSAILLLFALVRIFLNTV